LNDEYARLNVQSGIFIVQGANLNDQFARLNVRFATANNQSTDTEIPNQLNDKYFKLSVKHLIQKINLNKGVKVYKK
jgi:hypothetical protein